MSIMRRLADQLRKNAEPINSGYNDDKDLPRVRKLISKRTMLTYRDTETFIGIAVDSSEIAIMERVNDIRQPSSSS